MYHLLGHTFAGDKDSHIDFLWRRFCLILFGFTLDETTFSNDIFFQVWPYIFWFHVGWTKFFLPLNLYYKNGLVLGVSGFIHEVGGLSWEGCSFAIVVPSVGKWIEEKPRKEVCAQVVSVHHPHTKAQLDLSKQPLWIFKHLPRSFEKDMAMATFFLLCKVIMGACIFFFLRGIRCKKWHVKICSFVFKFNNDNACKWFLFQTICLCLK